MFYILAINKEKFSRDHPWFDILVPEYCLEGLENEMEKTYGSTLGKSVASGADQKAFYFKEGKRDNPFINIFVATEKNKRFFEKAEAFIPRCRDNQILELESYWKECDYRCVPFEYSWARSRSSHSNNVFEYAKIMGGLGENLDFTDLEEEFTKTQSFKNSYTPIPYDWKFLDKIKKEAELENELFSEPFLFIPSDRPNFEIVSDTSKEMLARTIYLVQKRLKFKDVFKQALFDFLRRTPVSEITDLVKRDISGTLRLINNESINLKREKVLI